MSKILILGFPSSGKTVLLGTFANWLEHLNSAQVSFCPNSEDAHVFVRSVASNLCDGYWPKQTEHADVVRLSWDLKVDDKPVLRIETLDYPGETLQAYVERGTDREDRVRTKTCEASLKKLDAYIREAGTVILLLDYRHLRTLSDRIRRRVLSSEEKVQRDIAISAFSDYAWQIIELVSKLRELSSAPSVTLALSKCDKRFGIDDPMAALVQMDSVFEKIRNCEILAVSSVGETEERMVDGKMSVVPKPDSEPVGMYGLLRSMLRSGGSQNVVSRLESVYQHMIGVDSLTSGNLAASSWNECMKEAEQLRSLLPLFPPKEQESFEAAYQACQNRMCEQKNEIEKVHRIHKVKGVFKRAKTMITDYLRKGGKLCLVLFRRLGVFSVAVMKFIAKSIGVAYVFASHWLPEIIQGEYAGSWDYGLGTCVAGALIGLLWGFWGDGNLVFYTLVCGMVGALWGWRQYSLTVCLVGWALGACIDVPLLLFIAGAVLGAMFVDTDELGLTCKVSGVCSVVIGALTGVISGSFYCGFSVMVWTLFIVAFVSLVLLKLNRKHRYMPFR